MSKLSPPGTVSLPMYDFERLRPAHDLLWAAIAEGLRSVGIDAPSGLTHANDVHALWHDQDLFLSQSCGWPLVTELDGQVSTIGTFTYDIPSRDENDGWYRSVIVTPIGGAADPIGPAAVNSFSSLSGWISLRAAIGGDEHSRPVVLTGSHVASLAALRDGRAAVAAIDGVTHALIARDDPTLLDGLVVIGRGPRIPCLPIVGPRSWDAATIAAVRHGIAGAVGRDDLAEVRASLLVLRFVPLERADYEPLRHLLAESPAA